MTKNKPLTLVSDQSSSAILLWIVQHPQTFGHGITWLVVYHARPMLGTNEETFGPPAGHIRYQECPWVGWFLLPTHVSKFQLTRGEIEYAVKTALVCKALGFEAPLYASKFVEDINRLAATKPLTAPDLTSL